MKKLLLTTVGLVASSLVMASAPLVVSFNQAEAIQKSKEGRDVFVSLGKQKEAAEKELQEKAKSIQSRMQIFEKQAKANLLSQDAMIQKQGDLAKDYRKLERLKVAMDEDLEADRKIKVEKLGLKLAEEAKKVFEVKGAKVLLEARAPGVLALTVDIDITEEVIKKADAKYLTTKQKTAKAA